MADFLKIIPFMKADGQDRATYSSRFYEYVTSQAELAEGLLDSCGARENRTWFFLRELVAAVRSFAKVAYLLRYLEKNTSPYEILDEETQEFQVISSNVREIFDRMLQKAFVQLECESLSLGITIAPDELTRENFPHFHVPGRLYSDMWVEQSHKEDEAIVKIATSFLEVADEFLFFCHRDATLPLNHVLSFFVKTSVQ